MSSPWNVVWKMSWQLSRHKNKIPFPFLLYLFLFRPTVPIFLLLLFSFSFFSYLSFIQMLSCPFPSSSLQELPKWVWVCSFRRKAGICRDGKKTTSLSLLLKSNKQQCLENGRGVFRLLVWWSRERFPFLFDICHRVSSVTPREKKVPSSCRVEEKCIFPSTTLIKLIIAVRQGNSLITKQARGVERNKAKRTTMKGKKEENERLVISSLLFIAI